MAQLGQVQVSPIVISSVLTGGIGTSRSGKLMSSIEGVAAELRRSGAELVTALQSTKEIKRQAFERLDKASGS